MTAILPLILRLYTVWIHPTRICSAHRPAMIAMKGFSQSGLRPVSSRS